VAERIRLLIRNGQPDRAAAVGGAGGIPSSPDLVAPRLRSTTREEVTAIAWVRLALSQDRAADALAIAKRWRNFCSHRGAIRSLIRWDVLMAQIHVVNGEARIAQRS